MSVDIESVKASYPNGPPPDVAALCAEVERLRGERDEAQIQIARLAKDVRAARAHVATLRKALEDLKRSMIGDGSMTATNRQIYVAQITAARDNTKGD